MKREQQAGVDRCCGMPVDPQDTDPVDRDPRDREMERRSAAPSVSLWLVVGVILLLGVGVYVLSAMF